MSAPAPTPPQDVPPVPQGTGRRVAIATASVAVLGIAIAAGHGAWHRPDAVRGHRQRLCARRPDLRAAKVPGYVVEVATENNRRVAPGQFWPASIRATIRPPSPTPRPRWPSTRPRRCRSTPSSSCRRPRSRSPTRPWPRPRPRPSGPVGLHARQGPGRRRRGQPLDLRAVDGRRRPRPLGRDPVAGPGHFRATPASGAGRATPGQPRGATGRAAKLFKARNDLSSTAITAPREGLVAARNVRLGEYVGVGTRLMAVAPTARCGSRPICARPSCRASAPATGCRSASTPPTTRSSAATVESLSAASGSEFSVIPPDNATGNFTKIVRRFPVRILFDARQPGLDRLGSGMSVEPRIAIGSHVSGKASSLSALFGGFRCATGGDHA
jgi:membrane fusion protein (multidrug efflux system)